MEIAHELHVLADACAERVGWTGCAVVVFGRPLGATDVLISDLEDWQLALGDGPSVAAFDQELPLACPDLGAVGSRFGGFVTYMVAAGMHAVASVPLMSRSRPIGAVTWYHGEPSAFDTSDHGPAAACVRAVCELLLTLPDWLADGGASDDSMLAIGHLMARNAISADDATARLRTQAMLSGSPVRVVSRQVLAGADLE